MRHLALVGLAACWSSSTKTPSVQDASSRPTVESMAAAAPAAAPTPRPATPPPPAPTPPPPAPYVLPAPVAAALAREPLAGNVLVPSGVPLHPTLVAARGAATGPMTGVATAMRVVRDHGDVVELTTAPAADCAVEFAEPYRLAVFLKRDKLYPRAKAEVVKVFGDGTAVAIDRGAAVVVSERGLHWETSALAEAPAPPAVDQLTYAVPAASPHAALPRLAGARFVCDRGSGPMPETEWRVERQRIREAEARERQREARRKEAEARERQRAAREARRKAEAAKRAGPKPRPTSKKSDADRLVDLLSSDPFGDVSSDLLGEVGDIDLVGAGFGGGISYDEFHVPWCGVGDASAGYGSAPPAAGPTVGGVVISWPWFALHNDYVVKDGTRYLGDVGVRCGTLRVAVGANGVDGRGAGSGMIGGGGQIQVWVPKSNTQVTWPDGTPAGTYVGHKRYSAVVEIGDRICVAVRGIAERVCHDKKTTRTEMSARYGVD